MNNFDANVIGIVTDLGRVLMVRKRDGQYSQKMDIIMFDARCI